MSFLRRANLVILAGYWIALFVGTHLPSQVMERVPGNDKIQHLSGYAGLAFLMTFAVASRAPTVPKLAGILAFIAVYAAADELTQSFVPGRICDFWDWCADLTGAVLGIGSYGIVIAITRSRQTGNAE